MALVYQEQAEDAGFGTAYSHIMIDEGWAQSMLHLTLIRRAIDGLTLRSHAI
jgi:hypothetical protein